jgi:hypothetical protein
MPRLFVDFEARFAQVQDALNQVTRNTERASKQMAGAFNLVKTALGGLSVGAFGRELIQATTQAEQSAARLDALLRATGGTVGITRSELDRLAESMEGALGIDDDEVRKAQATLIRFGNIQGDVFREALRLSADLAASLGIDVAEAAEQLGKAVQSPTEGLRALEQKFGQLDPATEKFINDLARQGKAVEAQREILRLYDQKISGTAQLMNTGFTKATRDVANAWDDFLKALGRTEGPMKFVREAFEGLAVTLRIVKGLIEKPPEEAGLAPLAEGVKAIDKEMGKLLKRQDELNAKQNIGHADAAERLKNEERINALTAKRTDLIRKYNELEQSITKRVQDAEKEALARQGAPTLGGKPKPDNEQEATFKRTVESLQDQIEKLKGISLEEQTLRDIRRGAYGELNENQKRQLLGLAKEIDAIKLREAAMQTMRESVEAQAQVEAILQEARDLGNKEGLRQNQEIEESNRAVTRSYIEMAEQVSSAGEEMVFTWDKAGNRIVLTREEFEILNGEIKKSGELIKDAAEDLGFTFSSAFEDAVVEGEKLSEVLKGIEKDIARIILRMTITKPLAQGLADVIAGGLGGIFGGGGGEGELVQLGGPRASGGPVTAGRAFLVGEEGPELFIPGRSGMIAANDTLGGVTINNGDIIISGSGVTQSDVRQALAASERRTIEAFRELQRR